MKSKIEESLIDSISTIIQTIFDAFLIWIFVKYCLIEIINVKPISYITIFAAILCYRQLVLMTISEIKIKWRKQE